MACRRAAEVEDRCAVIAGGGRRRVVVREDRPKAAACRVRCPAGSGETNIVLGAGRSAELIEGRRVAIAGKLCGCAAVKDERGVIIAHMGRCRAAVALPDYSWSWVLVDITIFRKVGHPH
jgi:hypothetical protein